MLVASIQYSLLPHTTIKNRTKYEVVHGLNLTTTQLQHLLPAPFGSFVSILDIKSARAGMTTNTNKTAGETGKLAPHHHIGLYLGPREPGLIDTHTIFIPGRNSLFLAHLDDLKFHDTIGFNTSMVLDSEDPLSDNDIFDLFPALRTQLPTYNPTTIDHDPRLITPDHTQPDLFQATTLPPSKSNQNTTLNSPSELLPHIQAVLQSNPTSQSTTDILTALRKNQVPTSITSEQLNIHLRHLSNLGHLVSSDDTWSINIPHTIATAHTVPHQLPSHPPTTKAQHDNPNQPTMDSTIGTIQITSPSDTNPPMTTALRQVASTLYNCVVSHMPWQSTRASDIPIPKSTTAAASSVYAEQWAEAEAYELSKHRDNNVFTDMSLKTAQATFGKRRVLRTRFVYKVKPDDSANGFAKRFRARRLVLQGHKMLPGVDFFETFAAIPKMSTWKLLLALRTATGWGATLIDVESAFLHSDLTEKEYCFVRLPGPLRFPDTTPTTARVPGHPDEIISVATRAVNGSPASPQAWAKRLAKFFDQHPDFTFTRSEHDPCLHIGRHKS